jgi:hypothetical protein
MYISLETQLQGFGFTRNIYPNWMQMAADFYRRIELNSAEIPTGPAEIPLSLRVFQ